MLRICLTLLTAILIVPGCTTTKPPGSARSAVRSEPQAVDGHPGWHKRGNPVRNAFNTFSY